MIHYKYPEEKEVLLHYAKILKNIHVDEILQNGHIQSAEDARELASFFWKMVDQTIIDSEKNLVIAGYTDLESCCEDVMQTLRSHFVATGYMEIWEDESDKA